MEIVDGCGGCCLPGYEKFGFVTALIVLSLVPRGRDDDRGLDDSPSVRPDLTGMSSGMNEVVRSVSGMG